MSVNFATYADLTQLTNQMTLNERTSVKSTAASLTGARKDTFLAHSSKDAEYLPGVIKLLENHGALVYFDLDDEKRIIINDGTDDRVLLGKDAGGF